MLVSPSHALAFNSRSLPCFKGSFNKDCLDYVKSTKTPSLSAFFALKDKNIKSLLDEKAITIKDISDLITDLKTLFSDYSLKEVLSALNNSDVYKFISQYGLSLPQAPLVVCLSEKQIKAFEQALSELNNPKLENTTIKKIQYRDNDCYMLQGSTKENFNKYFGSVVYFDIKATPQGDYQISRCESNLADEDISRLKGQNSETIIYTEESEENDNFYISRIIEIKPDCIIDSKLSDKLKGVFETTQYDFKNYPESFDVLSAVKEGYIEGGKPVSNVFEDDNYITFEENFSYGNTLTKRFYKKSKNSHDYKYIYTIKEGEKTLLDVTKERYQISDNKIVTKVNGKTYTAEYNGPKVTIEDNEGNKKTINLSKIAPDFEPEFFKNFNADILLNLSKLIKNINLVGPYQCVYQYLKETIETDLNPVSLLHEAGHMIEYSVLDTKAYQVQRKELIETYNQEFSNLLKTSTSDVQKITEYLSPISASDGLSETIADTNILLNEPADSEKLISARQYYLAHYFPRTVAIASKILGN